MGTRRDFTDRFLKALKPAPAGKRVIYMDGVVPQFGIRVTDKSRPDNIGSFVLVARFPGSKNPAPRRIGDYPDMPLAKAREIAREWREDIHRGVDPKAKEVERRRDEARRRADTFAAAIDAYADERLSRLRSAAEAKSALARYAMKEWGDRPISDIRRGDVKELIRKIHKDAPAAAAKQLSYLKTFFKWAADEELIEASPAANVKPLSEKSERDRVLSDIEIVAIWHACGELGAFGRAFRFMLATGQRRTEVGKLQWAEIDAEQRLWTLPRARTKAERGHTVPLSALAFEIIGGCPRLGPFVFTTGGERPISGWSKAKSALDRIVPKQLGKIARERGEEPPEENTDWHLHDLRRTAATNLSKLGVDRVTVAKILNHAEGGVTKIYDRHAFDVEKRRALDLWGERLREIVQREEFDGPKN